MKTKTNKTKKYVLQYVEITTTKDKNNKVIKKTTKVLDKYIIDEQEANQYSIVEAADYVLEELC